MAKITPLEQKFKALPRAVTFKDNVLPALLKAGISESTFHRDRRAKPESIPYERLLIYAGFFDCDVADLVEATVKLKPKSIAARAGLTPPRLTPPRK